MSTLIQDKRSDRTAAFAVKNANRRLGRKDLSRGERSEARTLRQTWGGAFGNLSPEEWNARIVGTTGVERATKNSKPKAG